MSTQAYSVEAPGRVIPRAAAALIGGAVAGVALAVLWSATLVDETIGFNVTNGVLGSGTAEKPVTSAWTGIVFALVSGVAGSFTACNVAGLCAIAPLAQTRRTIVDVLRPVGWLAVGACTVAGLYGAIGAGIGPGMPQLSTGFVGNYPVRILQSTIVFGLLGLAMLYLALAAAGYVRDPFARFANAARIRVLVTGGLIGAFLIGRPYPLFQHLFAKAASTHDPAYGALVFVLQTLGNIAVVSLLFVGASYAFGGRFPRWLNEKPERASTFATAAFAGAAVFLIAYWVVRVPAHFGIGWWPSMPWS